MIDLAAMRVGAKGHVVSIDGVDSVSLRLMEMGLLEGEEIQLLAIAPLGDPLEIRLGDGRLSLRRTEAARVLVQLLGAGAS